MEWGGERQNVMVERVLSEEQFIAPSGICVHSAGKKMKYKCHRHIVCNIKGNLNSNGED